MTKESTVFIFGILVLIVPYMGIPNDWDIYIFTIIGIILIIIGYLLRHREYIRSIEKENGERDTDSFVEKSGHLPFSDK